MRGLFVSQRRVLRVSQVRWFPCGAWLRALVLAGLCVACGADAPSYDGATFRCDAERPCPPGDRCVGGFCSGSGSVGVTCGAAMCPAGEVCCTDFVSPSRCQAASAVCAGVVSACDGPEDCAGDCCISGGGTACESPGECAMSLCRLAEDCGGGQFCCALGGTPWRTCLPQCGPGV